MNTMLATIAGVVVSLALTLAGAAGWLQPNIGQSAAAQTRIIDWASTTASIAKSNPTGATLYLDSSTAGSTTWTIFSGPPGTGLGPILRQGSYAGNVQLASSTRFVVAYNRAGVASAQAWSPSSGAVSSVSCPSTGVWTLSVVLNSQTRSISLPCEQ